jgi:Holliday junction resolvase RusA-like endonuclease
METIETTFIIDPIGKPRMTQRDKWKKRAIVERYFAYRDAVRLQANISKYEITGTLDVTFYVPAPKSLSKKERALLDGAPHTQKPDIDNLVKAFLDCFGEDKAVHTLNARKIWTTGIGKIVTLSPRV